MVIGFLLPGYIPARAGEASIAPPPGPPLGVHPRACGGSDQAFALVAPGQGTSPRVRGKPGNNVHDQHAVGYIPARAGEARLRERPCQRPAVHPRACGGSPRFACNAVNTSGTSPRVRGKPGPDSRRPQLPRYIPARAGEAGAPPPRARSIEVHPRACGGSAVGLAVTVAAGGTSPRVRGKPPVRGAERVERGYIPARAGEAAAASRAAARPRVHPRACGGSYWSDRYAQWSHGTSPRVRGKRLGRGRRLGRRRYIPARAGEAAGPDSRWPVTEVHPRACGGSDGPAARATLRLGTSPRVRGKRLRGGTC